jgi:hypothetical protein
MKRGGGVRRSGERRIAYTLVSFLYAILFVIAQAGSASASPAERTGSPDRGRTTTAAPSRTFRFALRALGTSAGEATLAIGPGEKVGDLPLRAVRVDARTEGLAARFLKAESVATTWVDARWLPVRARWDQVIDGETRVYRSRFDARGVKGTEVRGQRAPIAHAHALDRHPLDLVSLFAWLLAQPLRPGLQLEVPVFDGRRMFQVSLRVGSPAELFLPVGQRVGLPLAVTIRRGTFRRTAEIWVSDGPVPVPLKLAFRYGLIGAVEALLTEVRAGPDEPGAEPDERPGTPPP